MPYLWTILLLVSLALVLAATLLYVCARIFKRVASNRFASAAPDVSQPGDRVVWDITETDRRPVVQDGVVYIDRRNFAYRFGGGALIAFLVGKKIIPPLRASVREPYRSKPEALGHTDVPHQDHTAKHTDITCDPPQCESHQHADGAPHADTPHIDHNDTPAPPPETPKPQPKPTVMPVLGE